MARSSSTATTGGTVVVDPSSTDPLNLMAIPGMTEETAREVRRQLKAAAREEIARRDVGGYAWAQDVLLNASPAELAEAWPEIRRRGYGAYEGAWRDLARVHPAPYIEYAVRDDNPESPFFGQRLQLSAMHVEIVQALFLHRLVAAISAREHGATTIVLGTAEWFLGRNPDLRIKIIGENDRAARKRVIKLRNRIERSKELREIFPRLRPDKKGQWTMGAFYVVRSTDSVEPSVEGLGVLGSATGGRSDITIYDDAVGKTNALKNPRLKPQVKTSFYSDHFGTGATGRHWYPANFWAADDLTQDLRQRAQRDGVAEELPSGGNVTVGEDWVYLEHAVRRGTDQSPWPERWSVEDIAMVRRNTPPADMARGWECRKPSQGEEEIQAEWMLFQKLPPRSTWDMVVSAVDPASGEEEENDWTAKVTAAVYPVTLGEGDNADDFMAVHFFRADHVRAKMTARVDWVVEDYKRDHVDTQIVEQTSDGKTLADMVEDRLMIEVVRNKPTLGKRARMIRHAPRYAARLVRFVPAMRPEVVRAEGDADAPNLVDEILGIAPHDDLHDGAEMILDFVAHEYAMGAIPLNVYDGGDLKEEEGVPGWDGLEIDGDDDDDVDPFADLNTDGGYGSGSSGTSSILG